MRCFHYPRVDSTNLQAQRLWNAGGSASSAFAVRADTQTAGVGRHGRAWQSPPGGLWFSIAWPRAREAAHYQSLPIVAGLIVARTLHRTCALDCRIKWPNDVLVSGRKIAGVLCSLTNGSAPPPLILGVGVNGNFPAADLDGELRTPATTILDEIGRPIGLDECFRALLSALGDGLSEYDAGGPDAFLPDVRERLAGLGRPVRLISAGGERIAGGRFVDIDAYGRLILEDQGRQTAHAVGEIVWGG